MPCMARVPMDFHRAFHSVVSLHSFIPLDLHSHTVVLFMGICSLPWPAIPCQSCTYLHLPPASPPHVLAHGNHHNTTQQPTAEPIRVCACVCVTQHTPPPWAWRQKGGVCPGWVDVSGESFFSFHSHSFFFFSCCTEKPFIDVHKQL